MAFFAYTFTEVYNRFLVPRLGWPTLDWLGTIMLWAVMWLVTQAVIAFAFPTTRVVE